MSGFQRMTINHESHVIWRQCAHVCWYFQGYGIEEVGKTFYMKLGMNWRRKNHEQQWGSPEKMLALWNLTIKNWWAVGMI